MAQTATRWRLCAQLLFLICAFSIDQFLEQHFRLRGGAFAFPEEVAKEARHK
jgi:hypothetical protein